MANNNLQQKLKRAALFVFLLATILASNHIYRLSQRADGEHTFWPGESVEILSHAGESHTLLVCTTNADTSDNLPDDDSTESVGVIHQSAPLEGGICIDEPNMVTTHQLTARRPIALPNDLRQTYQLGEHPKCSIAEPFVSNYEILRLDTTDDTFVIDAYSQKAASRTDLYQLLIFLMLLWTGITLSCKSGLLMPQKPCKPNILHAPLAFLATMICVYLIGKYLMPENTPDHIIIPGYGELFVTIFGNFISFLGVSAFFFGLYLISQRKHESGCLDIHTDNTVSSGSSATQQSTGLRRDSVILPLLLAIGLSIIAIIIVIVGPLTGIALTELSSKLVSTAYLTAYFVLLAGVYEESLFRGIIQTSLMAGPGARHPRLQNTIAILISTALFALLHVPQSMEHLWALIPISMVSIASGILRVRSGALYQSILLHISYNAILLLPSYIYAVL